MLHEEVKKYRELSGDTNPNTPISRIGGYLDGYEKALEQEPKTGHKHKFDKIRDEIENYDNFILCANGQKGIHIDAALEIIDKYKVEDV